MPDDADRRTETSPDAGPAALAEALAQHGALRYADVDALEGFLHAPPRATPEAGDPAQPSE